MPKIFGTGFGVKFTQHKALLTNFFQYTRGAENGEAEVSASTPVTLAGRCSFGVTKFQDFIIFMSLTISISFILDVRAA